MHRIAATPGGWNPQAEGVIFIEQTPAPIIFLTAADTDIQTLAAAVNKLPFDFPQLRVANLLHLQQQLTIDTYADDILSKAKVIIVRLLGGRSYWSYGLEVLLEAIEKEGAKLIVIPGDNRPYPDLISHSNVSISLVNQFWQYLIEGGVDNFVNGLKFIANICLGKDYDFALPIPVSRVGIYPWQKEEQTTKAKIGILFYRAHYLSGNVAPIDALCQALIEKNLEPVPVFVSSPRDVEVQGEILEYFQPENAEAIQLLLNTTSFAVSVVNNQDFALEKSPNPPLLRQGKNLDIPVLQVIFSGGNFEQWESQFQGLSPRDVAMNIALPEVDGNIISRAISFKAVQTWNSDLETDVISYFPVQDRIEFVSELAANWIKLRQTPASQRRIALILANYPNRDGRLANGVGLDTPASCVEILQALQQAGYYLENIPATGDELIKCLTSGVKNDLESRELRPVFQSLSLAEFETYFASLPQVVQEKIIQRWGNINDRDFVMANTYFATDVQINSTKIPPSLEKDVSSNFSEFQKDNQKKENDENFATDVQINSTKIPPSLEKYISSNFSEFQKDSEVKEIDNFPIPGIQLGNIFVGIQPSRGYDIDPSLNYHAPDLEPTPNYLAFYYWLREKFQIDAIIHVGKHGNLEWLPGKSVGLSQECFPEIALGALPHFYPFIVNDPGEGSQAKRRSQAVIIDHLTPPMTRAELYGPLQQLETLIDEYYEAQNLDPSRLSVIRDRIINLIETEGLDKDLSFLGNNLDSSSSSFPSREKFSIEVEVLNQDLSFLPKDLDFSESSFQSRDKFFIEVEALNQNLSFFPQDLDSLSPSSKNRDKFFIELESLNQDFCFLLKDLDSPQLPLKKREKIEKDENTRFSELITNADGYLCELKEAQIRDGLHIFGQCPQERQLRDLIIAITRHPSTTRLGLTRALAEDLNLDFDPLTDDFSTIIDENLIMDGKVCRTVGDAVELLEQKAANLVENLINQNQINSPFQQTNKELEWIRQKLLPSLQKTDQEIINLLIGLDGKYIPSGSSGAPTRGRPDVLPTGRNFYSVDIRAIPTETAWRVGQLAAENLIERYTQENGEYPQTLGLSVWGTSTMRTGGDDIAEALALLGVKPVWDRPSRRVIDFEILPVSILGRPRVDVTLRISGFFRDAFPNIIDLFDQAVIAVANLDEPETENPLAAQVKKEVKYWQELGLTETQAKARSHYRIFGSKPGAYGAGLQGLIESQNWQDDQDLARAYINWSGYAYTGINNSYNQEARAINSPKAFSQRLKEMQIVLHNQDNREHDLLDSDDYYQFQGGMTVAVRALTGKNPHTYFGDNSMAENPKVRQLKEQIARVYRSRVVNPKWIAGVMRHGYKGAFEMAATIDYLFAYDATAKCVEDFMYQGVAETYIFDENVQSFIQGKNPWALRDMAERLLEANQRGLWQSANQKILDKLQAIALEAEGIIENLEFRI
ncbi:MULTISPECIES: cobaltochelatase subunit CobN [unclassified Okeania]|uniref:cobaltochelatase subunit CobN n=1 Tax=unclassified Okeania TaxID=2634635 RepID=UPI0013BCE248|nr:MULTISPECIES: cobaltochelatase subunit CobN [unclassified Okeania]NES79013.1 cobaltochelatase subunit CobN [Okeania sp. SIO1H4]NET22645.1 cobaltochelatase subunit CobN [Okeania sp. SIO1H5]NET95840.1 cobaltochelatase subunit CobN [Okeania sp. SIO1H2]